MLKSRSLRGITVAVAAASALVLGAGIASAGTLDGDYTTGGVRIRSAADTNATVYGQGYPGQGNWDYCYTTGTSVNGNAYWDNNKDKATGVQGYSSEVYLTQGVNQFTHC
ncbi:hypothetical protein ACWCXH_25815 [Kitasatospora sp. NPDC001660]